MTHLRELAARGRRFVWRRPEWWVIALAAAAWIWSIAGAVNESHAHGSLSWFDHLRGWFIMVAAMMFPLVTGQARAAAARSLWRRRQQAIVAFLLGYLSWSMIPGIITSALVREWPVELSTSSALIAFAIAACWQRTSIHQSALWACHREMPLAPSGRRAHADCLRYGWSVSMRCSITCWPAMAACAFASHAPWMMIATTMLISIGRLGPRARRLVVLRPLFLEKAFR